ncbi:glycosyltransferase [Devosia sp. MC521]|nr:glycosyltransferase [Devosia sp. MC521]QMW63297.1 glycosyltransferase [Devosia sp. MC521]
MIEQTTPGLKAAGVQRIVALPASDPEIVRRLEASGALVAPVDFVRLRRSLNPATQAKYLLGLRRDVRRVTELIQEHGADVVEVAGLFALQPAIAATKARVPLVWQLHSTMGPQRVRNLMGRIVAKTADAVMTSGKSMIPRHGGLDDIADEIIPFSASVNTEAFHPDLKVREAMRAQFGVDENEVVVGTLGNRAWQKRHELLLDAAALLLPQNPHLKFLVVGNDVPSNVPYYRREVVTRAKALNDRFPGRVLLCTQNAPVSAIMSVFDVFALTSVAEGASLVTAEAMAMGLPVVSVDVGSLPDLVRPGHTGCLANPNAGALSLAIRQVLVNRHAFGRAAREFVLARKEDPVDAHLHAYRYALDSRARSR